MEASELYTWNSLQYCGQPVFELVACDVPVAYRINLFEFRQESKKPIPIWVLAFLVARQGLEPWTHALKGRCSTN